MDKLKKLGKYFTKGLQAGVLASALIAGNVSCSNSAGGDSIDFNGGYVSDDDQTSKWPSYYINTEFGGQRFVNTDEDWFYDSQDVKLPKFNERYNNADQFINEKVADLQKLWPGKSAGSDLENKIYNVLSDYFNQGTSISFRIHNSYNAIARIFAITDEQSINNPTEYNTFKAAYHKLAADAYTKSVGQYVNNINEFPTLTETQSATFADELKYVENGKYNSNTFTFEQARATMKKSLTTIATRNNANSELLNKFVELALYNESLYGLNDFTYRVEVNVSGVETRPRSYSRLEEMIIPQMSISLDDRTM